MATGHRGKHSPAAPPPLDFTAVSGATELVELARDLYRRGAVLDALAACEQAARQARRSGDPVALADAATVIRTAPRADVAARVHALCTEALARLGEDDVVRTARVRAQLVATSNPFGPPEPLDLPDESDDPEAAFLRLQAWHAARFAIDHLPEQLLVADRAIELGLRTGTDEYTAAGRRWRMDAYAVLGDRIDLIAELDALRPLVARLDQPAWHAYTLLVDASQRLLEGRCDDALRLVEHAVATDPEGESSFFRLVFTSAVARQTGRGLAESTDAVRVAVDGLPYLARGWLCLMYKAGNRHEEAETLWRAIAPHVDRHPVRAAEWAIAAFGSAEVCAWLGDAATARVLFGQLAPYTGLQAIGVAAAPYDGPVDLALGRLAATLGDAHLARRHLTAALRAGEALDAAPLQAYVLAELARLGDDGARTRARTLATRLGMRPLLADLAGSTDHGPLTRREVEIAGLVAEGLRNAAIADRLTLSERTVENHVTHMLRKLDLPSRAGLSSWYARRNS